MAKNADAVYVLERFVRLFFGFVLNLTKKYVFKHEAVSCSSQLGSEDVPRHDTEGLLKNWTR